MDRFLFQPLDGQAVTWLRFSFAISLPWFFWSGGLQPRANVPDSFHWLYEPVFASTGYYLIVVLLCGLLAFGWRPRLCGFSLFILLIPLAFLNRGHLSRQVLLFALFAFAFIPSDVVRFPWSSENRGRFVDAGPCWPVRLIQIQLTLLYAANGVAKSSPEYLRGEALMDMSVSYSNFLVDMSSGTLVLGRIVMPVALAACMSALIEYLLAFGFWSRRLKWLIAALGISFHLVMMKIVSIFMLNYASMFLYLAFLLPLIARKKVMRE